MLEYMFAKRPLLHTLLICLAVFVYLAADVTLGGPLSAMDPQVTESFVASRGQMPTDLAFIFTSLGSTPVMVGLGLVVVVILVLEQHRDWALWFFLVNASGYFVSHGAKLVFARQRPDQALLLADPETTFSFPSGHSFSAAAFFGALTLLVAASSRARSRKIMVSAVFLLVATAIGLSRIYLAYHWLTDVLGGWALGFAWVAVGGLVLRASVLRGNPADATPRTGQLTQS